MTGTVALNKISDMKLVIKSCKSWQLPTEAPLPELTIPCGKEQISQCQRKKKLVNGQRTESVNIANKQTLLHCTENCRAKAKKTIAVAPPKAAGI